MTTDISQNDILLSQIIYESLLADFAGHRSILQNLDQKPIFYGHVNPDSLFQSLRTLILHELVCKPEPIDHSDKNAVRFIL